MKIFTSLNFNAVFYSEVVFAAPCPIWMYMTTFADMDARKAHWDAFKNHPDWKKTIRNG